MRLRRSRQLTLVAALLVLPLLALAVGPLAPHEGHDGHLDKNCLACRWAAHSVADVAAPVALPASVEPVAAKLTEPSSARVARASLEAAPSRGPPLA